MYQNVSVPYCPFYRPFHDQISAHVIKRFTNNATGLIPPLSLCCEAGGNRCSCRDAHPFPLLRDQPRKPGHPLVFPPQGCLSSFATHDRIASAQVPLCEQAQCSWASGRAWDGCPWSFTSTCTSCCATEEQSASAGSGEQESLALTTTQARRRGAGEQSWRASCPCLSWQGKRLPGPRYPGENVLS